MKSFLAVLVVSSAVASAAESTPIRVAISGLQGVNVSNEALSFYAEHLASNLRAPGLSVITAREISTLLGLERQKALLGCSEASSSCIAELANALGVDAIIVGDVGRFDDVYQVNVKALNAADARVLAARSVRVKGDVATLDAVAGLGAHLARALLEAKGREVPAELLSKTATRSPAALRTWALVPAGVGLVSGAVGGVLLWQAKKDYDALLGSGSPLTAAQSTGLRNAGATKQTAGGVLLAIGATAVVGAGAMFLLGGPKDTSVAVVPLEHGAMLSLGGALP